MSNLRTCGRMNGAPTLNPLPRRWQTTPIVVIAASMLSGCATLSTVTPPGRNVADYKVCLQSIKYGPTGAKAPVAGDPQSLLAAALVRGDGLTNDDAANKVWSSAARPPSPPSAAELIEIEDTPFQEFLDCYLGQPVSPIDYEERLLRGHIALSMIADYSATAIGNATASKRKQYASTALGLIAAAELSLRQASWQELQYAEAASGTVPTQSAPKTTYSDNPMRFTQNVSRVDQILTAGAFAESVTLRNAYGLIIGVAGEAAAK